MFKLNKYKSLKIYKKNLLKFFIWEIINILFFNTSIPGSQLRYYILKLFGAKIGKKVILKPNIKIKYPWNLEIGSYCWIGEKVWIDNVAKVTIGNNTCISQGVYICTASHNYKNKNFDLILLPVRIGNNCWVAAKCMIAPGANLKNNKFLKIGSRFI